MLSGLVDSSVDAKEALLSGPVDSSVDAKEALQAPLIEGSRTRLPRVDECELSPPMFLDEVPSALEEAFNIHVDPRGL